MKRDKYQQLPLAEKMLKLKEAYLSGRYEELVIHDEYIYPPIEKDIKEILISQFGISLLDEYIRNSTQEKLSKKSKLPLPIIFALIHHHIKSQKYENLIRIIMQHVDRKGVEHYHILIYVVAKIYERFSQYKKSIFYLENLLKESPFFSQGVYDLCYHYAFKFQRQQEACIILQRHIGHCQPNEKFIHSLYISICSKFKLRTIKDVLKTLNNKSLNLIAYFNLGIYCRQAQDLEKSYQIFTQIISKLSKAKLQKNGIFNEKDEKLLLLSKINLLAILQNPNFQSNRVSQQIQVLFQQISFATGCKIDDQVLCKLLQHKKISNSISSQSLKSQNIFKNFYSMRKSKQLSRFKEYKQEKTSQNEQKSIQNKENVKLHSFNNDFSTIRQYNDKKLKYLLQKQKEINHFFKNLVIKKDDNSDKVQIQYKITDKSLKASTNQSSIIKAKSLNNDQFQFFQKQFENKRKLHQFKYDDVQLEKMLGQIMTNFQNCVIQNKKQQNKIAVIAKNYSKVSLPRQNIQYSKHSKHILGENSPKTSYGARKTQKNEKRIAISQITNRQPKTERNGNFRIKQASKEKTLQINQQKQLGLYTNENVLLAPVNHSKNQNKVTKRIQNNQAKPLEKNIQLIQKQQVQKYISSIVLSQQKQPESLLRRVQSLPYQQSQFDKIIQNPYQKQEEEKEVRQKQILQIPNKEEEKQVQMKNEVQNNMLESQTSNLMNQQQNQQNKTKQFNSAEVEYCKNTNQQKKNQVQTKITNQQQQNSSSKQIPVQQIPVIAEAPENQQQQKAPQLIKPPEIKPIYDPFASSFQLTGFNKASLSKFRQLKKKKKTQPRPSVKNDSQPVSAQSSAKKIEQPKPIKILNAFEADLKQAQKLQDEQKYEEAYQLYTRLYKMYKKQFEKQIILIKIGSLFQSQQKFAEAQKTYLKCTKFNNVDAFLKLGALLLKNGRINSGVQNIEKANCLKRNDIQIENKLVYGYSLREQTMEKALNLAQMILKKQPQSLQTLIITANILEKQGKIKQAIDIMTAIDKFKSAQYIKHYLGILYLQDSNLTEAFNHFKAALTLKADYLPSLIQVATIISEISPKQSISILQKVLQIQPQNRKALARLGKIYESIQNDFENAMAAYQTALETQQNYESYMKIGDCLARKQSYIEALLNYKQALNMKKTHEAYAKVANMFHMKQQYTKAIENYEHALNLLMMEKDGNSAKRRQYLSYLGNLSLKIGNYDAGIRFFEEIQDYEESIQILKLLAEAYLGKKQYSIALQKYEKASELAQGKDLQILENIAICFDKMQGYLASKTIYEKILQKDPDNIRCMNNLANILLITGETNQSFYMFENMLQKAPKNMEKRLKVVDIYAEVGDWSKVEFHLLQCLKQKENDERVIERLINLYKEKRDIKMANKYEKKLAIIRTNRKGQQKAAPS